MNSDSIIKLLLNAVFGGFQNTLAGKDGCSLAQLMTAITRLVELLDKIHATPNEAANLVHTTCAEILSDVEGVADEDISNPLLPFAELLALFIELFTPYFVEVSSLQDENDNVFFQIDEKNNKFYFAFFHDHLEFAFNNFDEFESVPLNTINLTVSDAHEQHKPGCEGVVPSKLRKLGASEDITGRVGDGSGDFFASSCCTANLP